MTPHQLVKGFRHSVPLELHLGQLCPIGSIAFGRLRPRDYTSVSQEEGEKEEGKIHNRAGQGRWCRIRGLRGLVR